MNILSVFRRTGVLSNRRFDLSFLWSCSGELRPHMSLSGKICFKVIQITFNHEQRSWLDFYIDGKNVFIKNKSETK